MVKMLEGVSVPHVQVYALVEVALKWFVSTSVSISIKETYTNSVRCY